MFFASSRYNYDRFDRLRLLKDMGAGHFGGAPAPGDRAPDFEGRTLGGEKFRLKNSRGKKNVVLIFGSATCPQTAASIAGLNQLYNRRDNTTEFLFVYVREGHPGERIEAHKNLKQKRRAAEKLRDEEIVEIPILVDDVSGRIHRKYGKAPNPTFIVDKSGRIAFRSLASRPRSIAVALDELLESQQIQGLQHAVVCDGEDLSLLSPRLLLRTNRALQRGGRRAVRNFKKEMGLAGRLLVGSSRVSQVVTNNPGKVLAGAFAIAAVLGGGIWAGMLLRRRRLGTYRSPYESRRFLPGRLDDFGEYEAVGI